MGDRNETTNETGGTATERFPVDLEKLLQNQHPALKAVLRQALEAFRARGGDDVNITDDYVCITIQITDGVFSSVSDPFGVDLSHFQIKDGVLATESASEERK